MKGYLFIITFFYIVDSFADNLSSFSYRVSSQNEFIQLLQQTIQKKMGQKATKQLLLEIKYLKSLKKALRDQIRE